MTQEKKLANWSLSFALICGSIATYGLLITHHPFTNEMENIRFYLFSGMFIDDAFYYYKTALNAATIGSISFDSINPTNGFHPLWFLICLPLVSSLSQAVFLNLIIWIQLSFYFLSAFPLVRAIGLKKYSTLLTIFAISLLSTNYFLRTSINGLETSLYVFTLSWVLFAFRQYINTQKFSNLVLAMSFCFLARIDAIFLIIIIIGIIFSRFKKNDAYKIAFVLGLEILIYCSYNFLTIGEVMPVSGLTKEIYSSYAHNVALAGGANLYGLWYQYLIEPLKNPYLLAVLGINLLSFPLFFYKKEYVGLAMSLFIILKFLIYVVNYKSSTGAYNWYYLPDFISTVYICIYLAAILLDKINKNFAKILLIIFSIYYVYDQYNLLAPNMNHHFARVHNASNPIVAGDLDMYFLAAKILNDGQLPKDTIIGMHNSGVFGFFSNYHVVNLDGLINGKKRLIFNRQYPYDWIRYVDEAQAIDAYLDFIPPDSIQPISKGMGERGFTAYQLTEKQFNKYGNLSMPSTDAFLIFYYKGPQFNRLGFQ